MKMQAQAIHDAVHGKGGLLEQAQEAKKAGTLVDFFTKLVQTLGPIFGPLIQALIAGFLSPPAPPNPTPAGS